ncbi:MAG: hypothetical protein HQL87_00465 [Magnetococcales bacterium]|nr:hypothetical protein [Magnetococcales bacterium]
MDLSNGHRIGIIGGGPAGALTAYYLLHLSQRVGLHLEVDIYEPKSFIAAGASGCNHCGGVISETLIQMLALEGIIFPPGILQSTIDSYTLHTESGAVRIQAPLQEMRIATIFRGGGPRIPLIPGAPAILSFDHFLLQRACAIGARHIPEKVVEIRREGDRPQVVGKSGTATTYDFLVGATGIMGSATTLLEKGVAGYRPPVKGSSYVCEFYLGPDVVEERIGHDMHIFFLNIPGIQHASIMPKGAIVTVCLVGDAVDKAMVDHFLAHPEVTKCFPVAWVRPPDKDSCACTPKISLGSASMLFGHRVAFTGDCGVTRLYKDGIGAAYRTARACATTLVFWGISPAVLERYFQPVCAAIAADNRLGRWVFHLFELFRTQRFLNRAVLAVTRWEQGRPPEQRLMSMTLWDVFSGSATYRLIFKRLFLNPVFLVRFAGAVLLALMVELGVGPWAFWRKMRR